MALLLHGCGDGGTSAATNDRMTGRAEGGAGVEWYFGWRDNSLTSDLGVEDMRLRANM